jgi:hypothetical protein
MRMKKYTRAGRSCKVCAKYYIPNYVWRGTCSPECYLIKLQAPKQPSSRMRFTSIEHRKTYVRDRLRERKLKLTQLLGGQCARCDNNTDLEFDHIDPTTKLFNISGRLGSSWDLLLDEVKKCQLLCKPCHYTKTRIENKRANPSRHGSWGMWKKRRCKCELCGEVRRASKRRNYWNKRKIQEAPNLP